MKRPVIALTCLTVIGLLFGLFVYSLRRPTCSSGVIGTAQADLNSFQSALEQYRNIGGHYPSQEQGLQVLLQRPVNPPLPEDWVQTVDDDDAFLDPWRTPYRYRYDGTDELEKPEIISAGPDKAFGTEDDLSSQTE